MGCDIHIVTEIKQNGRWIGVDDYPKSLNRRDYSAFAILADVRNYFNYNGFQPKGLPCDLSKEKFRFNSIMDYIKNRYNTDSTLMLVFSDGKMLKPYDCDDCIVYVSEERYLELKDLSKNNPKEFNIRYTGLGYSTTYNKTEWYVRDASVVNGEFKNIPFKEIYPDFISFANDWYEDEWDEDVNDFGSWDVDFGWVECGDYHSASYLTLNELINMDYSDYTSNRYKMDKIFYDAFVESGGVFPDNFKVVGNTNAGGIGDAIREAFNPTVVISWKMSENEVKELNIFKGIEELKDIAKNYNISNYDDIRIVFAFDN